MDGTGLRFSESGSVSEKDISVAPESCHVDESSFMLKHMVHPQRQRNEWNWLYII